MRWKATLMNFYKILRPLTAAVSSITLLRRILPVLIMLPSAEVVILFTQLFVERASRNNGMPLFRYGKARRSGDGRRMEYVRERNSDAAIP